MARNPNRRRPTSGQKHGLPEAAEGCEKCGCPPVVPSTGLCEPCTRKENARSHATPKSQPR